MTNARCMEPAPVAPESRTWPHFDPPNILWYFGAITAAFFSIAQLSEVPDSRRGLWVLLSALAWIALYLGLGNLLRQRGWWIAGGLAVAVAVSLVAVVVFAFERLVGVWPADAQGTGPSGAFLALALVTACVGFAAFAVVRFPFILFASAVGIIVSTQDSAVSGAEATDGRAWAALGTGGALVLLGLLADRTDRRTEAFWAHVVGLFGVAAGLFFFAVVRGDEDGWLAVILLGALVLLAAPLVGRATWAAYGVLGFYAGAVHFLDKALSDSILALPLVAVSAGLVALGIGMFPSSGGSYVQAISTRVRRS
jgi:hypothetical protein